MYLFLQNIAVVFLVMTMIHFILFYYNVLLFLIKKINIYFFSYIGIFRSQTQFLFKTFNAMKNTYSK